MEPTRNPTPPVTQTDSPRRHRGVIAAADLISQATRTTGPATTASTRPVPVEDLYRAHARELTAFAAGMLGTAEAGDAVASVFARLLNSDTHLAAANPKAYVYKAVYNECRSLLRRARRLLPGSPAPHIDVHPDPDVGAAVAALPDRQRAVVLLTYWQDLHPDDVAARLGISAGSVKKHLARARSTLRTSLNNTEVD